jgi:CRISPR/Cas system-associated protein Cas5 (RAMP superfamily)
MARKIKTLGDDKTIISITDIIEQKVRKESELRAFEAQLKDLLSKKFFLEKEIQIHEFIIQAVRDEITPQAFIQGLIRAELKDE